MYVRGLRERSELSKIRPKKKVESRAILRLNTTAKRNSANAFTIQIRKSLHNCERSIKLSKGSSPNIAYNIGRILTTGFLMISRGRGVN